MKVRSVQANNHAKQLELTTYSGKVFVFPYVKLKPCPTVKNKIANVYVDDELGREAVTYELESGEENSLLLDQVLHYNEDPDYMLSMLLHRLTLEAKERLEASQLSMREIARRLGTSPAQIYRLVDTNNTRKTANSLLGLLHVLGTKVDIKFRNA